MILISKDFFIQNSSFDYLRDLRKLIAPYPDNEIIESEYLKYLKWKLKTEKILSTTLEESTNKKKTVYLKEYFKKI